MGARSQALGSEADARRAELLASLTQLGGDATQIPVIAGWDVRDVVWHVAFWADHGADALELAAAGRGAEFVYDKSQTDAMNEAATAEGHAVSLADALAREAAAFGRLRDAIAATDDARLDDRLGNGDALEDVIRYDGPDHYAEHAAHLDLARRSAP